MVFRTFRSHCKQRGPLNEHPVVDVRRLRTMCTAENDDAVGDLVQSQENQPRHTTPLDRSHESSEYLKQITADDFFCSLLL